MFDSVRKTLLLTSSHLQSMLQPSKIQHLLFLLEVKRTGHWNIVNMFWYKLLSSRVKVDKWNAQCKKKNEPETRNQRTIAWSREKKAKM